MSAPDEVLVFGHGDLTADLSTPTYDQQAEPGAEPYPSVLADSPDHPELRFVQAAGYTPGRPDGKPLWIVIHDMEASETSRTAENTAAYFANPGDGRNVSSHYTVDNDSVVQCVLLKDSAWTVGNRPGNNRGINWELSGFASQSRAQWLDDFGLAMFGQIRPILRSDAAKFGIPLTRRTVAELKAWKPGITSHNDLRLAFGGTTHTDPGPNFPWDVFLSMMGDEAVTDPFQNKSKYTSADGQIRTQDQKIHDVSQALGYGVSHGNAPYWVRDKLNAIEAKIDALSTPEPAPVDLEAVRQIVREELDKTGLLGRNA
jgi:N-acetyl-anhydromuramyl-L-alanine amidase AmpD